VPPPPGYNDVAPEPQSPPPSVAARARGRLLTLRRDTSIEPEPSISREFFTGTPLGSILTGIGQGAGSTAYNLGRGAIHLANATTLGGVPPDLMSEIDRPNDITEALRPSGPYAGFEHGGKVAEQIGEFFVPGGTAEMQAAGKLPLLGRMGSEALSGAGVGAAQGDNPLASAAGGAAGPLISGVASKAAPKLINTFLGHGISRTGASAGRAITEGGIVAPSLGDLSELTAGAQAVAAAKGPVSAAFGSLLEKTLRARSAIGREIGMAILRSSAASVPSIDAEALYRGPIQQAINDLRVVQDAPQLESAISHLTDAFTSRTASRSPNAVTPAELWAVRDSLDKAIEKMGGFESDSANLSLRKTLREVRSNFADAISSAIPEIREVNRRYSDMAKAVDAVVDKIEGGQNRNAIQMLHELLYNPLNYAFGVGAFHVAHDPVKLAALLGARSVLGSTAAVTSGAAGLDALGTPLASQLLSRGGAAAAGAITHPERPSDPESDPATVLALARQYAQSDPQLAAMYQNRYRQLTAGRNQPAMGR
jgi:hypothetical protein